MSFNITILLTAVQGPRSQPNLGKKFPNCLHCCADHTNRAFEIIKAQFAKKEPLMAQVHINIQGNCSSIGLAKPYERLATEPKKSTLHW